MDAADDLNTDVVFCICGWIHVIQLLYAPTNEKISV
jgi:hypothetical protein